MWIPETKEEAIETIETLLKQNDAPDLGDETKELNNQEIDRIKELWQLA